MKKRQRSRKQFCKLGQRELRMGFVAAIGLSIALASSPLIAAQAEGGDPPDTAPRGVLQIVFSGGPVGVVIMLAIIATSLLAAYLIFDHMMTLRRRELLPDGLAELVRQALINGDLAGAKKACLERPSLLSYVLTHGLAEMEFGWSSVEKAIEESLADQAARLFRKLEYLSVIANIAPMLGLLGTVVGMIMAFQEVASTQGMASAPQLAEGIYQALVTTVGGLVVAIPAIGAFAVFRNRVDQFVAEAAYLAQHVFTPLRKRLKQRSEPR